ncbi:MAG TPA: LuxR C-terminal-related transcriptional regulator [Candidatus Angelobacter sp.]|nr:LuxR C-terminal-related transcriptional regulator [Candidatus Angelobacter sp.]
MGSIISSSPLQALASVLRTSPESDALVVLGRLLNSLPIGFHVSDCGGGSFHILYANRVWEQWLDPEKLPIAGKPLADLFPSAEEAGILELMREVCATGQPKHLKSYEFRELGGPGKRNASSRWDWEIYPLSGPSGVTHLLNVIMDVTAPRPRRNGLSKDDRDAANLRREEASGVLRIFGVAPPARDPRSQGGLSEREREIADFLAMGFTNRAIARHLSVSSATVSSHVAHILAKLGFRSRAQVAAWVVGRRLRPTEGSAHETGSLT